MQDLFRYLQFLAQEILESQALRWELLTSDRLAMQALVMFLIGPAPIVYYLLRTNAASLEPDHASDRRLPFDIGCVDSRYFRLLATLGGAASFAFGLYSFYFAQMFYSFGWTMLGDWFASNSKMQAYLGVLCVALFVWGVYKNRGEIKKHTPEFIRFLAHLLGCGFVTAYGPFFPIFWVQEFFKLLLKFGERAWIREVKRHIIRFRDSETLLSLFCSLPVLVGLDIYTRLVVKKRLEVAILGPDDMKEEAKQIAMNH